MEYEYVALRWTVDHLGGAPHCYGDRTRLLSQGWEECSRAPWELKGLGIVGGACIMRRPKDEPRMWTKSDIQEIARTTPVVKTHGSVLNERAMQADLCGRLEDRNAELQGRLNERQETVEAWKADVRQLRKAIDAVVEVYESVAYKLDPVCRSIKEHLYSLASSSVKEESNG